MAARSVVYSQGSDEWKQGYLPGLFPVSGEIPVARQYLRRTFFQDQ